MEENNTVQSFIPWYKTRWFWGIIIGALIAWGLFFYFFDLYSSNRTGYWMFVDISIAFGATPAIFLAPSFNFIDPKLITTIFLVVYYMLMSTLLYNTFKKSQVRLYFPIIFVFIFLLGTTLAFSLSGF